MGGVWENLGSNLCGKWWRKESLSKVWAAFCWDSKVFLMNYAKVYILHNGMVLIVIERGSTRPFHQIFTPLKTKKTRTLKIVYCSFQSWRSANAASIFSVIHHPFNWKGILKKWRISAIPAAETGPHIQKPDLPHIWPISNGCRPCIALS